MSGGLTIPTVAELTAEKSKDKDTDVQSAPDEDVTKAVTSLALFDDESIPHEVAEMVKALNRKEIDNDKIASTLKRLLHAKKTIIIGSGKYAEAKQVPDNGVILSAVKFIASLRNVVPVKEMKVKGKVAHLHGHGNIPQGPAETLKQREKSIQEAPEVAFEELPDAKIN